MHPAIASFFPHLLEKDRRGGYGKWKEKERKKRSTLPLMYDVICTGQASATLYIPHC